MMRFFSKLFSSLLLLGIAVNLHAQQYYTVGVVPQFETSKIHKIWRPILDHLAKATGARFELRGSHSIAEFEKQFAAGEFDFAYMNPLHLVIANEKAGYIPLVRDTRKQLYGVLVVRKDSPIQTIDSLNNTKIAFPAPNALGASLMIRQELKNNLGIDFKPVYVKSHDSVYLNVLMGITAAGGGVQKTLSQQKPEIQNNLRILYTTSKVNPHPFSALPSVPESTRQQVTQAFINLAQSAIGRKLLSRIPIGSPGVADMQDYLPLKKLNLDKLYEH